MTWRNDHQGTVTLVFTDIEGSTRLLASLGSRYEAVLADHRRLLRQAFSSHQGIEVDTQGDALFYAFAKFLDAVSAAAEAQRALVSHDFGSGVQLKVRMGIHTGEPTLVNRLGDGDYFGEIGLLERLQRTATVRAETDCDLYCISGEDFLAAVSQAPVISGTLLGGVMRGLARTHPSYRATTPPTTRATNGPR